MSSSIPLSIGTSGLAAATLQGLAACHNLSNLLTKDFRPLSTAQRALPSGGIATDLVQVEPSPTANAALENRLSLTGALYGVKQNAVVIRSADQMLGTILDLRS